LNIAGVIIAGGTGSRIGGHKPVLPFGDGVLLDAIVARAKPQVEELALNVPGADAPYYRERYAGIDLVFDSHDAGPLGGLIAGLNWLQCLGGAELLATFPCDTPFLPLDLVRQLRAAAHGRVPVVAADDVRTHALCGLWPLSIARRLCAGFEAGELRSMMSAVEALGGHICHIKCGEHAFLNINTRADLTRAELIRTQREP